MTNVTLRFVGSGDAFGSGGRLQTCLHLRGVADGDVLVDCGASSLSGLKQAGIDPSGIGWVLLTHLHGDHFAGVPFLILDGQFSRRTRPLVVAGPAGTAERVTRVMELLFPGSVDVERRFATRYVEFVNQTPIQLGPALTTPYAVEHPSGAAPYALRIEYGGRVFGYSGDTQWTDALIDVARDADLFVCEAYTMDREVRFHLSHAMLLRHRPRLNPRRMILTHLGREMLERLSDAEWECAHDGLEVSL